MRADEDFTPNNYDIQIDIDDIPPNLIYKDVTDLQRILDKSTPLSKKIHLWINSDDKDEYDNKIGFKTSLTIENSKNGYRRLI